MTTKYLLSFMQAIGCGFCVLLISQNGRAMVIVVDDSSFAHVLPYGSEGISHDVMLSSACAPIKDVELELETYSKSRAATNAVQYGVDALASYVPSEGFNEPLFENDFKAQLYEQGCCIKASASATNIYEAAQAEAAASCLPLLIRLPLKWGKLGSEERFSCRYPGCTKDFLTKQCLSAHLRRCAYSGRQYECAFSGCGKKFSARNNMLQHRLSVHDKDKRPFPCKLCSVAFIRRDRFTRHMQKEHPGETYSN